MNRKKLIQWNFRRVFRIRRNHKDVLFVHLFHNKKDLLSLYNALNNSNYTDENELYINTLDDLIYISVKNDVSFIIGNYINLYEHQSSFCPNMPIRGLIYLARLYKAYIDLNGLNIHGTKLVRLPKPRYVIFYNGTEEHKDVEELRLSDAFDGDGSCLEFIATMYNINYGHNQALMTQCKILSDYAYFVARVRYYSDMGYPTEKAVDLACVECIEKDILKEFLLKNRSEVVNMFLVDYKPSLQRKMDREEGREEGRTEGRMEGLIEGRTEGHTEGRMEKQTQIVKNMLARNMPDEDIIALTECTQEFIDKLRNSKTAT